MTKPEIIPAILPKDFAELEEKAEMVKGFVKTLQIDVCDGQFVPNATWPYRKHDDAFEKILKEDIGLPGWETMNHEIDLMANRPEEVVNDWVTAGAMRVILHVEARGDIAAAIGMLRDRVEIGMAISVETPISELEPYIGDIQVIQCMGIDNIGFQGQEFDQKVIAKVAELKKAFPNIAIAVDGGVSLETGPRLIAAGADRLVVGSAIFESDNAIDAVESFKRLFRR